MFAYCGDNPVCRIDEEGSFDVYVTIATGSGEFTTGAFVVTVTASVKVKIADDNYEKAGSISISKDVIEGSVDGEFFQVPIYFDDKKILLGYGCTFNSKVCALSVSIPEGKLTCSCEKNYKNYKISVDLSITSNDSYAFKQAAAHTNRLLVAAGGAVLAGALCPGHGGLGGRIHNVLSLA